MNYELLEVLRQYAVQIYLLT